MSLKNERERINTQTKLARLEQRYQALQAQTGGDEDLREMTMDSLKRSIHQLREELARYEAHHRAPFVAST